MESTTENKNDKDDPMKQVLDSVLEELRKENEAKTITFEVKEMEQCHFDMKHNLERICMKMPDEDCVVYVERRLILHRAQFLMANTSREDMIQTLFNDSDPLFSEALFRIYKTPITAREKIVECVDRWLRMSPTEIVCSNKLAWLGELSYAKKALTTLRLDVNEVFAEMNSTPVYCLSSLLRKWWPGEHEQFVRQYLCRVLLPDHMCTNCFKIQQRLAVKPFGCCKKCGVSRYCSVECQTQNWKLHKRFCGANVQEMMDMYTIDFDS